MIVTIDAEKLVQWVAQNSVRGSRFVNPVPLQSVETFKLLDQLMAQTGLEEDLVADWFNSELDRLSSLPRSTP